jgi:hypothetical protein
MKDYRITIKAFANNYFETLKKGTIPRADVKREFYDKGRKLVKEDTLDTIWNAFMDNTYDPNSKSLGRKKYLFKEKKSIMKETVNKGPKPKKILLMDSTLKKTMKVYDSAKDAALDLDLSVSAIRNILAMTDEKKLSKTNAKYHLFYEQKKVSPKEIKVTNPNEMAVHDYPDPGITQGVIDDYEDMYEEDPRSTSKEYVDKVIQESIPYRQQMLKKLDDARTAYIEALKNYAICAISEYGIQLEEKDIHLVAYLDEDLK